MAVTPEELIAYVGTTAADEAFVQRCLDEATEMVGKFVEGHEVPEEVFARAVLECGSELFHRKQSPSGISQFATLDGQNPARLARDPMTAVRPLLLPFLPGGLA